MLIRTREYPAPKFRRTCSEPLLTQSAPDLWVFWFWGPRMSGLRTQVRALCVTPPRPPPGVGGPAAVEGAGPWGCRASPWSCRAGRGRCRAVASPPRRSSCRFPRLWPPASGAASRSVTPRRATGGQAVGETYTDPHRAPWCSAPLLRSLCAPPWRSPSLPVPACQCLVSAPVLKGALPGQPRHRGCSAHSPPPRKCWWSRCAPSSPRRHRKGSLWSQAGCLYLPPNARGQRPYSPPLCCVPEASTCLGALSPSQGISGHAICMRQPRPRPSVAPWGAPCGTCRVGGAGSRPVGLLTILLRDVFSRAPQICSSV